MDVSSIKTPAPQATQVAKRTEEARQAQRNAVAEKEPEVKKAPEPRPNPVVNTLGQTTGRLLNVTA